jgi:hypothetical protein
MKSNNFKVELKINLTMVTLRRLGATHRPALWIGMSLALIFDGLHPSYALSFRQIRV